MYFRSNKIAIITLFVLHSLFRLTWTPAWISNYIHYKVLIKVISLFSDLNGVAVQVWEWISNFITCFIVRDYLSMLDLKWIHFNKRGPRGGINHVMLTVIHCSLFLESSWAPSFLQTSLFLRLFSLALTPSPPRKTCDRVWFSVSSGSFSAWCNI